MKNYTLIVLAALGLCVAVPASAETFKITLDTSTLAGTQTLAFGFTDGDGTGTNILALSDFDFDGGAGVAGTDDCGGSPGCSGGLGGSVVLTDAAFLQFFSAQFNPGASLSFILNMTNNFAGGTPDAFAMYVCDATLSTCYSDDAGTLAMLMVDLTGGVLAPSDFTTFGASDHLLPAPVVSAVPEPGSILLFGAGLSTVVLRRSRRG